MKLIVNVSSKATHGSRACSWLYIYALAMGIKEAPFKKSPQVFHLSGITIDGSWGFHLWTIIMHKIAIRSAWFIVLDCPSSARRGELIRRTGKRSWPPGSLRGTYWHWLTLISRPHVANIYDFFRILMDSCGKSLFDVNH